MARKPSRGRQKIEMAKMQNKTSLQVTFSKRRAGLMKKASELCTLTGAEIALIIFSPGNKPYSFGNPSVESVINRFLFKIPKPQSTVRSERLFQVHRQAKIEKLNDSIVRLQGLLEAEKKRRATLDQTVKLEENRFWWEAHTRDLGLDQLKKLKKAMKDINRRARNALNELINREIQRNSSFQFKNAHENPSEYAPNFVSSGVARNVSCFPQDDAGPSTLGDGFRFTSGASSSSNDGMDLNLRLMSGFGSFVVSEKANHQGYGPPTF